MSDPILFLISHGHSPPLSPAADLKYNIRRLANPPKHIRDAHNGTSKRLREWMRADSEFNALIETAVEQIRAKMQAIAEQTDNSAKESASVKSLEDIDETSVDSTSELIQTEPDVFDSDQVGEKVQPAVDANLTVGVSCEMGRHRSVAFVEELADRNWPGWEIRVQHRDVDNNRLKTSSRNRKAERERKNRGGLSMDESM